MLPLTVSYNGDTPTSVAVAVPGGEIVFAISSLSTQAAQLLSAALLAILALTYRPSTEKMLPSQAQVWVGAKHFAQTLAPNHDVSPADINKIVDYCDRMQG